MTDRRIALVTGAAGFIGSWLCEALLEADWSVRAVDAFTDSYDPSRKRNNIVRLAGRDDVEVVEADLVVAPIAPLMDGVSVVIHLAAESRASASWAGMLSRYVERNVLATQRLLDGMEAAGVQRLVYASSASVYGVPMWRVAESETPHPQNPYGVSKLAAENLAAAYASRGLHPVILRYFSVYGPRQRPDMAVHRLIDAALQRRPLPVHGEGTQRRAVTYVADAVTATVAAITASVPPGTAINIAGRQSVSVLDLASTVAELVDLEPQRIAFEPNGAADAIPWDASIRMARDLLAWEPRTELSDGVRRQIEWQRAQRAGAHTSTSRPARMRGAAPRGARLMIYTQDGLGLGHLRRASSVATEFLRRDPSGWVLTTSDSPLGTLLRDVPNHDYLKLPSIVKSGPGDWHPLSMPLDLARVLQLRSRLIREAAEAFEPDVLLVDHMPHGAMGELIPTLEVLHARPSRIVLGLRDIIDTPEVVEQRWRTEGAYDALSTYYDQVLIYGSQEIFDMCAEYHWPRRLADLVSYCGYMCTPEGPDDPRRMRARRLAGVPRGALIAAMAGGGADGHELMSTLLSALPTIHAAKPCVLEIVTGPFMPDAQRADLKLRAQSLPVRMRTMVRNPLSRVAAADLVVAMAGYNTTMEILRLGTPALMVPRRGPSQEQRMRTARFAQRGWLSQLDPDDLSAGSLAEAVLDRLSAQPVPAAMTAPDLGGVTAAVEHLHRAASAARADAGLEPTTELEGVARLREAAGGH